MEDNSYITVIGAVNIDITGTSYEQLVLSDSNQGNINISFGGVGRNIAENMCRLKQKVELITVLGDDIYANELRQNCDKLGIGLEHSMTINNQNTSIYICINNNDGDMTLAVNDMKIYDFMTVDFIASKMDFINKSKVVVIDTNVPKDVIEYVANNCTVPIIADPVSIKKSEKLLNILPKLYCVKPNRLEAEVLANMVIDSDSTIKEAAETLLAKGIDNVFISLSDDGVYYANANKQGKSACWLGPIVNTTGCGDAFLAAITWALVKKFDIDKVALAGIAAASVCAAATGTISPELTEEKLCEMLHIELN